MAEDGGHLGEVVSGGAVGLITQLDVEHADVLLPHGDGQEEPPALGVGLHLLLPVAPAGQAPVDRLVPGGEVPSGPGTGSRVRPS